jgi:hypothetical protein
MGKGLFFSLIVQTPQSTRLVIQFNLTFFIGLFIGWVNIKEANHRLSGQKMEEQGVGRY